MTRVGLSAYVWSKRSRTTTALFFENKLKLTPSEATVTLGGKLDPALVGAVTKYLADKATFSPLHGNDFQGTNVPNDWG